MPSGSSVQTFSTETVHLAEEFTDGLKERGTNRFGVHMRAHEKSTGRTKLKQCLDVKYRDKISQAGASAVNLDLRPIKFAEKNKEIALFVESISKPIQTSLYGVPTNRKSHLLTKTPINLSGAFLSAII